ncbi:MAG: transketolase [Candidatus Vogelbacteria bacterium CG10_big_fil_rev_8_21_14_0_10_50_13]|uniref:Transketolase n=1 Tax=Candidatus Vogelbacteria bacterium CG10_big_fil_rev_8_21_14_0_10_50_13 TaxID=1975044 RepID=A0A2H0RGV0_9BACT|nr:MAG: transketolase [Candidatus Vogelbacteria bacterium CG10_big_fil_rev_8_21_14_0_10_50_13]
MSLSDEKIKYLAETANEIRQLIIKSLVAAGSGHTAGPLGMADVFTLLYFHALKHDPSQPDWPERDRLVLSNGHICPVLYATMARAGYFPEEELLTLRKFGSKLQGHPHREYLPALETSSGPLGSGLSQAVGMALASRMDNSTSGPAIYCLMSDGEQECGQTWEAAMLAGKEGLGNLIAIIDRNNIQIDGYTEDIMPLEPLAKKYEAWNWHVQEVNGHNFEELNDAIGAAGSVFSRPSIIIANTIPGKGVKAWEKKYEWHGKPPTQEEGEMALKELKALAGKLED